MAKQLSGSHCSGSDSQMTRKLEVLLLPEQTNAKVESPATIVRNSTATDDALSTTELLEQILSHLSVEDLILLCRVSRHWRNATAGSSVLQRAMFFECEPELPSEWHLQWNSIHHTLLREALATLDQTGTAWRVELWSDERCELTWREDYGS